MWFWTKKKSKLIREDKVWMHSAARYLNLTNDLKGTSANQTVLVTCFFQDTHNYVSQLLLKTQIPFNECTGSGQIMAGKINLIPATVLQAEIPERLSSLLQAPFDLFLPEHHPLYSVEKELFKRLEALEKEVVCRFYLALEDPLFTLFGASRIKNLMYKLGMTEGEHLTHPMISNAIENAQKKTEQKTSKPFNTDSAEDWYKKNIS